MGGKGAVNPGKYRQLLAAIVANLSALSYGSIIGWQSPVTLQLQSENNPLGSAPMTYEATSWLNGVMCITGTLATVFIGMATTKFDRKITICSIAIPFAISWLLTVFASNQIHLFIGRFFAGIGGAVVIFIVPAYVSEIASDQIRGMLGSLMVFGLNLGILLSYILGAFLSFHTFALVGLSVPLLYLTIFIFMPESPVYLIRQNRLHEAARSLMWLRGGHRATVEQDMLKIQAELKELNSTHSAKISDLFRDRGTIKGLVITLALFGGQQLCGIFAMINYTEMIFRISGSTMSPNMAAITIGAIQVIGSYLSTSLMERMGRRLLLLVSCAGMCICHYVLASFCLLQNQKLNLDDFGWVPVVSLSIFIISYCLGMGPGPYVITSEIFSRDISGMATTAGLLFVWIMAFFVGKFFPNMVILLGMDGCFFLLGSFCAGSFFFTLLFIPETQGRPRQDIVDQLNGVSRTFTEKIGSRRQATSRMSVPAIGADSQTDSSLINAR